MKFSNHKIVEGGTYRAARKFGGKITPTVVVLHDTAGRLDQGNSADYLQTSPSGTSVQFVIERNGSIEQQVPLNRRAGHAGRSEYHGVKGVNNFSIGIEIVNPGRMTKSGPDHAVPWFKKRYDIAEHNIEFVRTEEHGAGLWMDYTEEQIVAVEELLRALFDYVPTLEDIVTHWYISPGRKSDTNPLFPLELIKARILGRDDLVGQKAIDAADDVEAAQGRVQIDVPHDTLNMRRWPSFNPNVIGAIPDGVVVPVIRSGSFADREWHLVRYGVHEGWIVARYAAPYTV